MSLISRFRSLDPTIVALTAVLTVFGLLMLMSASGPIAMQRTQDTLFYVARQIRYGVFPGILLFLFFALVDYRKWKSLAFFALVASIGLLVAVFLPGLGMERGGSQSWLHISAITFQPSEFVKLTFLLYLAAWLASRNEIDVRRAETGLVPFVGVLAAVVILLILQPDTGSMAVIVGMSLMMYLLSGAPIVWFIGLGALCLGLLAMLIRYSPYRAARFFTFLHPEADPLGIGFQFNQALLAIGSGGLFGLGYGHSRQKYLYLPEAESDSIIAVMGEELGLVGVSIFLFLIGFFIYRCFAIAKTAKDPFGKYLAVGIGAWISIQTFLNVGSMIGLVPMTGVTLPFVSHGGSALAILLAAAGLVAGIPRTGSTRTV